MKYVRLIDTNGLFLEDTFVEELTELTIETPCEGGLYHPRWNGEEWVEGLTQEQIDELNNAPVAITESERIASVEQALNDMIMLMMI